MSLLLGVYDLKRNGLLLIYLEDRLEHQPFARSYPVAYIQGHLFFEWNHTNVLLKSEELQRQNLPFLHPTTDKIFQNLKRGKPSDKSIEAKQTLEAIGKQ